MPDDGHNSDGCLTVHMFDLKRLSLTYSDENCTRRDTLRYRNLRVRAQRR